MSPSTSPTRPIRLCVALGAALTTAGITAGCLYDSTGPDSLLTEGEMRRLFMDFTHGLFQAERDSTLFGRQPGFGCRGISFGNLDSERSNDTTIAFSYRATPKDCDVRNGPDILYSGAPDIAGDAWWTRPESRLYRIRFTGVGAISYRTVDGRKGECAIDLTYGFESGATDHQDDRWVWSGTACGLSMDTTLTRADYAASPASSTRQELDAPRLRPYYQLWP